MHSGREVVHPGLFAGQRGQVTDRNSVIGIVVTVLVAVPCWGTRVFAQVDSRVHPAPDFGSGGVWLDQGARVPHHIADYRGHVVLIDFWEYTCINCIRDFGVLKRWYNKYRPYGFEVIGVHFGEFNIGFKTENVRSAAQHFRLPWPVVADQQGTTWKAYAAEGWPTRYLIDPQGRIVMKVFGEGNNREMEDKIRELLAADHPEVMKLEEDPDENEFRAECGITTQETYVGEIYGRSAVEDMAGHHAGETIDFQPPHSPPDGGVMLVGRWQIERDGVASQGHGAAAELRYHARSVYAVMGLTSSRPVRVNLFLDGVPLAKESAAGDVQFDSKGAYVDVSGGRMYYLVRTPSFGGHLLALQPEGNGLTLNSFTYGNDCQLKDEQ